MDSEASTASALTPVFKILDMKRKLNPTTVLLNILQDASETYKTIERSLLLLQLYS